MGNKKQIPTTNIQKLLFLYIFAVYYIYYVDDNTTQGNK